MAKWTILATGTLLTLAACGPATPAVQPTSAPEPQGSAAASSGKPGSRTVIAGDAAAPDLSPVPAPGMRVMHFRWKRPAATVATLARFTTIPSNVVDAGFRSATRDLIRDNLWEDVDVDALAELVDVDAPLDAVLVVGRDNEGNPKPMAAYAVGITSLERAKATAKERARQASRGVWRLAPSREFGDTCVLAASAGKTPGRLVCGDTEKEVLSLARYLATTVATEASGNSDMHVEMRLRPVLDRHRADIRKAAGELRDEVGSFERKFPGMAGSGKKILDALAQELIDVSEDADAVVFDLDIDDRSGIRAKMQLRFSGQRSWTVGSLVDGADLGDVAPPLFWRLPKDSDMAGYNRSVDPARYEPVLEVLRKGATEILTKEKVGTPADRAALVKLLRLPVSKHAPAVTASGHFTRSGSGSGNTLQGLVQDSLGWYLYGVESSPATTRAYLNEMVRAYNRASLQKQMKDELGSEARSLPQVRVKPAPFSLGAGAMAIEIVVPQIEDPLAGSRPSGPPTSSKPKRTDVKVYVLMLADGKRSWIGLSSRRDDLAKLMAKLRKAGAHTLDTRADLALFKQGTHAAGSFTHMAGIIGTIQPIVETVLQFGPGSSSKAGQRILGAFGKMPNGGKTPITSIVDVQAGSKPTTTITLQFPRESLEDLGFLVGEAVAAIDTP